MTGVPLTVLGGFLGAGKTTALNHLLLGSHGVRYAVLVNDFGDLAIDGDLVTRHGGDTITFANGCVCCTLGDNLLLTVDRLLESPNRPEHFLVEASGVADPRGIADLATLHPDLRRDLIVVLVDAGSVVDRARDPRLADTVQRQIRPADLVVLNKCDQIDPVRRAAVDALLAELTGAPVLATTRGRIPLELLRATEARASGEPEHRHAPEHPFTAYSLALPGPVDLVRLRASLAALDPRVLRAKGFVRSAAGAGGLHRVELAGRQVEIAPWQLGPKRLQPRPALVFIGLTDMPDARTLERLINA